MPPATTKPPSPPAVPRVVVAEDDQSLRELIVMALRKRHLRTIGVEDGHQARAVIQRSWESERPVSLLITDLWMPRLAGLELLAFVDMAPNPLPVIVISSFISAEMRQQAEQRGARAVFSKPFDMLKLLEAVERILGG